MMKSIRSVSGEFDCGISFRKSKVAQQTGERKFDYFAEAASSTSAKLIGHHRLPLAKINTSLRGRNFLMAGD